MKYTSLILKIDPDTLYSPTALTEFGRHIGYIEAKKPEELREQLQRMRLYFKRQAFKKFPQENGKPIPDGKIEVDGRAFIDGWWGWRWIKLAIEREIALFKSIFQKLQGEVDYSPVTIGELAVAENLFLSSLDKEHSPDEQRVSVGEEVIVLVAVRLLVSAPSSPVYREKYIETQKDLQQLTLPGGQWQLLASQHLERAVIDVLGKPCKGVENGNGNGNGEKRDD